MDGDPGLRLVAIVGLRAGCQFCAGLVPLKETGELTPSLKQERSWLITKASVQCNLGFALLL